MSFAIAAVVTAAVAATGYQIHAGQMAAKAQESAAAKAEQQARAQADAADQAQNRANQKKAIPMGAPGAAGAPSATMLTGAAGVDPNSLLLGKSTLLGQ